MEVRKLYAFRSKPIDARCGEVCSAITTCIAVTHVIYHHDDKVGTLIGMCRTRQARDDTQKQHLMD